MQVDRDIRWLQRFDNFNKAFHLLKDTVENETPQCLSDLEKEGLIKRFEFTLELAWENPKR